ncbi:MAG: dipicolinate synthase subunit DpsA [Clostridia bacterium]|nr:dipicolinate synthase subunit DpsA [Clostridia bacterium]
MKGRILVCRVSVIGGDLRQLTLAELMAKDGYDVNVIGFGENSMSSKYKTTNDINDVCESDIIILPMPVTLDFKTLNAPFEEKPIKLSVLSEKIKKGALILGGRISKEVIKVFKNNKCIDYYNREELMIKNAVPTAEGAIEIAMEETPITLKDSNCLVIGYGRIGKVLSALLKSLGANVCVSARKYSDLAWIDVNGYKSVHNDNLKTVANNFDLIFNTAPALILDEEILKTISPDCVVIDLASKPGGVDFEKAQDLGLKVIWALSLPGKCAPISSGKIIKETILNILHEEGV